MLCPKQWMMLVVYLGGYVDEAYAIAVTREDMYVVNDVFCVAN